MQIEQHPEEPHDGQPREVFMQLTPGRGHARPAVADRFDIWIARLKFTNQIRAMQVNARFADGEEDFHAANRQFLGVMRRFEQKIAKGAKKE